MGARWWMIAGLLLGAATGARGVSAQAPPADLHRIGTVDVQRVMARSVAGTNARQDLERARAEAQKEIAARRAAIDKLRDELLRTGSLLAPDARSAKQAQLESMIRDAGRAAEDFQRALEERNGVLVQSVLDEITALVTRFGREKGYHLIVEKRTHSVIYAAPVADVTDEIIQLYDQQFAQRSRPAPQKP